MQPESGTRKDLAKYRIETAKENLTAAKVLLDNGLYKDANNRAYYAVFHALNAIHAISGDGYKKHKDAVANFNKKYIHTEAISDFEILSLFCTRLKMSCSASVNAVALTVYL